MTLPNQFCQHRWEEVVGGPEPMYSCTKCGAIKAYSDRFGSEEYKRITVLYLENEIIGDGDFSAEVAMTLREYADAIDAGKAGRNHCEIQEGERGTRLTAIGVSWSGERIPLEAPAWTIRLPWEKKE